MELLDYLAWRNDVPLLLSPFNEVDNVIFSYLSYIEFGKLLENGDGFFDLKEQYEHFCEKHSYGRNQDRRTVYGASALIAAKNDGGASFSGHKGRVLCEGF